MVLRTYKRKHYTRNKYIHTHKHTTIKAFLKEKETNKHFLCAPIRISQTSLIHIISKLSLSI